VIPIQNIFDLLPLEILKEVIVRIERKSIKYMF